MRSANKSLQYGWKSAEGTRERDGGERKRTIRKRKGKTRWTQTSPVVEAGPFLGVGWVDLPPQRRRCSVGHQDNRNARERRKSSEILNCAAVPGFKDIPETKN